MRHAVHGRKLNRTSAHRKALRRNLVQSLIEHGQVRTTLAKAKDVRPFAERLVTLAIDGSLAARQRAIALLNDRAIIPAEHREAYDRLSDAKRDRVLRSKSGRRFRASTTRPGVPFTAESVIHRLFGDLGPKMKQRNEAKSCSGGYTRIIKLSHRRLGDAAPTAIIQFVDADDQPRKSIGDQSMRRRRAQTRFAKFAGKVGSTKAAAKAQAKGKVENPGDTGAKAAAE
jgi:large subunit ribosomal protein L17